MPRTISTALQAELDKTVTRLGYLVSLNASPAVRLCDLGTVTWNSLSWSSADIEVRGIGGSTEKLAQPSLKIQNLDDVIGAGLMNADMSSLTVDVYQVAAGALAVGDVVRLGRYFVNSAEIGLDSATVSLVPEVLVDAYSPRRRIDTGSGFSYALPEGTQIAWGNEIYFVGFDTGTA